MQILWFKLSYLNNKKVSSDLKDNALVGMMFLFAFDI